MNKIQFNKVKLNFVSLNKVGEILSKVKVIVQEFWQQVTLRGVNKLRINDMKYNSISSMIVYGAMEQKSTPSENSPVYPVYYGGKYVVEQEYLLELPSDYARLEGIAMSADTYYQITGFKLKGNDYLNISFTPNKACNLIGCYTTANATDNYSIYLTTTSGGKYLRYADGTYDSAIIAGTRYNIKITPTGCTGFETRSTWTKKDFTASVDMLIGSTSVDATSSKFDGIIHGPILIGPLRYGSDFDKYQARLILVPCERVSDGVVGYYDTKGRKFYEPTVGAGVMTEYDGSNSSLDKEWLYAHEYIKVVNADNEDMMYSRVYIDKSWVLCSLDDVTDSAELVSGLNIKKINYRKLTGDETFGSSTAYGKALYLNGQASKWGADKTKAVMCSHFVGLPPASSTQAEGTCFFNSSGHLYFRTNMTADEFTVYLKKQAAIGKPVYVWYVSTTETTEQVSGQKLLNLKGDCTIIREGNSDIADISFDVTCEVKAEAPSPEPEEPESSVIEYHFDIPMEYDDAFLGGAMTGTLEGDYTYVINKLRPFYEENKVGYDVPESVMLEKTNITVNGYRAIELGEENDGFVLATDAEEAIGGGNSLEIKPTYIYFEHKA